MRPVVAVLRKKAYDKMIQSCRPEVVEVLLRCLQHWWLFQFTANYIDDASERRGEESEVQTYVGHDHFFDVFN